jgi:uncharacterized protein (DUF433 family)
MTFNRITHDPNRMGGKPCIRDLRVTVGMVVGLMASGTTRERILQAYPYLEPADLDEALAYVASIELAYVASIELAYVASIELAYVASIETERN